MRPAVSTVNILLPCILDASLQKGEALLLDDGIAEGQDLRTRVPFGVFAGGCVCICLLLHWRACLLAFSNLAGDSLWGCAHLFSRVACAVVILV